MMKCPKCGKRVSADFKPSHWIALGADLTINAGIEIVKAIVKGRPIGGSPSGPPSRFFTEDLKDTYHCPNCGYIWEEKA